MCVLLEHYGHFVHHNLKVFFSYKVLRRLDSVLAQRFSFLEVGLHISLQYAYQGISVCEKNKGQLQSVSAILNFPL